MKVRIIDIVDEHKVVVEVDKDKFIAEWDGEKPEKNEMYDVEMDIDDELIWKTNICLASKDDKVIIQEERDIKIVAQLNYNKENDLATLRVYDSIVLVDVEEIGQDIYNQWVEIHCHLIRLSNVNM